MGTYLYTYFYATKIARLKTFESWPRQMNPKAEELAQAGFFYKGISDQCTCFFCGISCNNWEFGDNAFQEHINHNSKCKYIQMVCTL